MYNVFLAGVSRPAIKLAFVGAAALLMAGCSSDATRFADNGMFGATKSDVTPTASIPNGKTAAAGYAARQAGGYTPPSLPSGKPLASITSTPLEPPNSKFAAAATPSPTLSRPAISAPATTGALAPSTSLNGWRADGGTPIVVAQGESASMLATRYGVPVAALLRVNNFTSPSQIQPGARLVVPVYSAAGASRAVAAPHVAEAPRPAAEPRAVVADAKSADLKEKLRFRPGAPAAKIAATEKPAAHLAKAEPAPAPATHAEKAGAKPEKTAKAEPKVRPGSDSKVASVAAAKPVKQETPGKTAKLEAPVKAEKPPLAAKPDRKQVAALEPKKAAPAPAAQPAVDYDTKTSSLPPAETDKQPAADSDKPEFRWPARGRVIGGFKSGGNDGINIALPEGTAVKAADGGVVAYAGSELKGYGNLVLIRHPNGFVSAYANNGDIQVKRGDAVKRGQTIATSGQSGNVSSPQLHFELRKGSTPVDPTGYLAGL